MKTKKPQQYKFVTIYIYKRTKYNKDKKILHSACQGPRLKYNQFL